MNENSEFPTPGQSNQAPADPQTVTPSDAQSFAFCQNCGRELTRDSARVVGQFVYCEPCLQARLAGAPGPPPPAAGAYPGPSYNPDPSAPAWIPGSPGTPNPGLATLLGFIPGVGAMYNEQYAKGIVHLIVFVVLVTVSDSFGIFGLFVAGWEFYMAIDANHTARARRDGLPLPNPFGLNDIGERLGFGKSWPGNPEVASAARSAASQASQAARDAAAYAAQASDRGSTAGPRPFTAANPYSQAQPQAQTPTWAPGQPAEWSQTYTGPSAPPLGTYPVGAPPPMLTPLSRFPVGAVWLIGLGSVFLLTTTGLFNSIHPHFVFGIILIGLGLWIFARRMAESGLGWQSDGTAMYRYRVFRALRVSLWLVAIGLWLMLDAFRWVHLHYTWPLLLIVAGVMALLERVFLNASQADSAPTDAFPAEPFPRAEPAYNGDWSASAGPATPPTPPETAKGRN